MYRVNGIECDTAEEALKLQEESRMRRVSAQTREEHQSSKNQDLSRLPSEDPRHVCGMFCDGQDGSNSHCARRKQSARQSSPVGSGGCYDGTCGGYNCMRCNKDY